MEYGFFAFMSRLKLIKRWGLMRNTRDENLSEHSLEVAMLAHLLATVSNVVCGNKVDADKASVIALYHDVTETITGDMPTPVKYFSTEIKSAYDGVDAVAKEKLIGMLPNELKSVYADILYYENDEENEYLRKIVKAADTLSAYIKCIEEKQAGNKDFVKAEKAIKARLTEYKMPEVDYFMDNFIGMYQKTLDEM